MKTQYDYGLSKIYELVINANPSYAFLLDTNTLLQNKFVVAHVLGHSDFFKHNLWFQRTSRNILDLVSEHARRVRQYTQNEGTREVERFLDAVLSISMHVDPFSRPPLGQEEKDDTRPQYPRHPWEDLFPDRGHGAKGRARSHPKAARPRVPPEPDQDLLRFFLTYADHLEDWQKDILAIVREESLYFVPQMMTKIMNEGWASFWHNRILRAADLTNAEFTEFARLHAAVCTPGELRLNPYHVGLRIWEDIEKRFGREKMFEVRELDNDASFIRLYLTEELCEELDLFLFALEEDEWKVTSKDWERVRDALVDSFTNFGQPVITVEDGDYQGRRELYLKHRHDGRDLDLLYAERTLQHVYRIWRHPTHLESLSGGKTVVLSCADGETVTREVI